MGDTGDAIRITPRLAVPRAEVGFETSRSGGPGGQNVNKVETKVTILFDIESSAALSAPQKARLRERLASRLAADGTLRVSSQRHRTQLANRDAALERFAELLRDALAEAKPRKKTKPTAAARAERLAEKRIRGGVKRGRRPPRDDE